ncbi:hypothetical protein D6829_00895 [Candidatus Pacearchaeota archaeon]|nr:MAG: hypothetical protein D6829_00895 [Candidatus Pacearchaeota archaeon]
MQGKLKNKMSPKWHILSGFIAAIFLIYFFGLSFLAGTAVFASSFLIDIDHYFLYVFKKKNFNIRNSIKWNFKKREEYRKLSKVEKRKFKHNFVVFHGIEFIIVLVALSFINKLFTWILIGSLIHLIMDYAEGIYFKEPIYPKVSQIYLFYKKCSNK